MSGDELRLKHSQTMNGTEWMVVGQVIKVPDSKFAFLHIIYAVQCHVLCPQVRR